MNTNINSSQSSTYGAANWSNNAGSANYTGNNFTTDSQDIQNGNQQGNAGQNWTQVKQERKLMHMLKKLLNSVESNQGNSASVNQSNNSSIQQNQSLTQLLQQLLGSISNANSSGTGGRNQSWNNSQNTTTSV